MNEDLKDLNERLKKIDKLQDESEKEMAWQEELKNYQGEDEIISFSEGLRSEGAEFDGFKIKTGLLSLDTAFKEIRENDLVVISGDPGAGKTTLAMSITANISEVGVKSLWFTLEVGVGDFLRKFGNRLPDGFLPRNNVIYDAVRYAPAAVVHPSPQSRRPVVCYRAVQYPGTGGVHEYTTTASVE